MSALAGLFHLNGRPAELLLLRRMAQRLAHRGTGSVHGEGHVGLVACSRRAATTERFVSTTTDGRLAITADVRLDNREELIRALSLRVAGGQPTTDAQLLLTAYDRWQEGMPERLAGDFAFALWDARRQRLFCARDIYGVRPFYYVHQPEHTFAFASEIKALLALPTVIARPNGRRIALHLANVMEDQEITFYEGIFRLPPAHWMSVTRSGVSSRRYWNAEPGPELRLRSAAEYGEAFRTVFFEAVRCRLQDAARPGALLSGGLDSSSIVCAARQQRAQAGASPLHTFSVVYRNEEGDERSYLDAVLSGGGVTPHLIDGDALDPLQDIEQVLRHTDEPPFAANLALNWAPYRAAGASGVDVLLDGLFGDDTLFHGKEQLAELFVRGRWIALWTSLQRLARNEAPTADYFLKEWVLKPIAPAPVLKLWRSVRGAAGVDDYSSAHLVSPEFRSHAGSSRQTIGGSARRLRPQEAHRAAVRPTWQVSALELADKSTHAFGVEARYPFADRRLIEFCLSVPAAMKFDKGWTRMLVRRGLAGVLPEPVRWRGGKAKPGYWVGKALLRDGRPMLERMVQDEDGLLEPYVDLPALRSVYAEYQYNARVDLAGQLWRALLLGLWLETLSTPTDYRNHPHQGGDPTPHSTASLLTGHAARGV